MDQHGGISADKVQKIMRREKTEGSVKRRRTNRESSSTEKKDKTTCNTWTNEALGSEGNASDKVCVSP